MGSIRDLMTTNPTTCETSSTITDVAKVMKDEDVGPVPVTEGGRLVGIVTDRDIVVRVVAEGRDPSSTTVREIVSSDLVTVQPDTNLEEALNLMAERQVRRLPVVEGDQLIGIVAQADIARAADEERTGEVVQQISE
ncbi:MAG: CBS domain-containing protein [Actinomycetota bacterium]|nr:CBS domain-containing protein [Actinomycetota bacterium]